MAGQSSKLPQTRATRSKIALGEPIETRYHKIRRDGKSENSPIVNTSAASRDELGFEVGKQVRIDVYQDCLIMRLADPDEVDND